MSSCDEETRRRGPAEPWFNNRNSRFKQLIFRTSCLLFGLRLGNAILAPNQIKVPFGLASGFGVLAKFRGASRALVYRQIGDILRQHADIKSQYKTLIPNLHLVQYALLLPRQSALLFFSLQRP